MDLNLFQKWTASIYAINPDGHQDNLLYHTHPKHRGTEPNQIAAIITELKIDRIFKDAFFKKTYF